MSFNKIYSSDYFYTSSTVDYEEQMIMQKLIQYGVTPTGNKTIDKAKLHEIELRKAQNENSVSNNFLTVSKAKQKEIQEKKQENNIMYPNKAQDTDKALKAMGEQIYLEIKMRNKKNSIQNKEK